MSSSAEPVSLASLAEAQDTVHNPMPDRNTLIGKVMFGIALTFAVWQIYIAAYAPLSSVVLRAIHVGFLLLMVFGLSAAKAGRPLALRTADWVFGIAAFLTGLYQLVFEGDLILRAGDPTVADIVVGSIAIVLVFEGARRIMGWVLPLICLVFCLFALFGQYLPAPLNHRGFDFEQVVDQFSMGMEGIYGTPTYVSATYIFLFIVFSSFLERAGIIRLFTCLILGMGVPTIPNYIITSSLVGPALLDLGVPLIVSHMFVFYFGIMADLTPPVALAAFAAAPIAKASGLSIGIQCMRIAIAGFVVPFMAVYTPALMLQDGGPLAASIGFLPAVIYVFAKAVLSICLWGIASVGYWGRPLAWWERLWATAGAFCLVTAVPMTDEIGFALAALFFVYGWYIARRQATVGHEE